MESTAKQSSPEMLLARRQKRLALWYSWLSWGNTGGIASTNEDSAQISALLDTFALLLAKAIKAQDEKEKFSCEERLQTIEREILSMFEARRLMTSSIGIPAIAGPPQRG